MANTKGLGFKTYFGTTAMSATEGITSGLMTGMFMLYLTDYAGIGSYGAVFGATLLFVMRFFDMVNDPFEGWIIDRSKPGKLGKYKPFCILGLLLCGFGVIGMFFVPKFLSVSPVSVAVWIAIFYIMNDIGAVFYCPNPLFKTITLDPNERGKLLIGPRLLSMILAMLSAPLITIINSINKSIGDMQLAFGITVSMYVGIPLIISMIGISLVKERYKVPENVGDKVKITDIFMVIKENKALRIKFLWELFAGFVWTFLFATALYYIKWGFCADLSTGAVDADRYGSFSMISNMLMLLPLIVGTVIAAPLMKKFGSPIKFMRFIVLLEVIPCGAMFVFQILGFLHSTPALFFLCMGVCAIAIGMGFIPGETIVMETMDYGIYITGKDRSALCHSAVKFLTKLQSAVAAGIVGALLTAVGDSVDSSTGDYIGDMARMPSLLNWFIVIMGLIPFVLGGISLFIMKLYPVTNEVRAEMRAALASKEQLNE